MGILGDAQQRRGEACGMGGLGNAQQRQAETCCGGVMRGQAAGAMGGSGSLGDLGDSFFVALPLTYKYLCYNITLITKQ